jgi:hypothetical protein
LGVQSPICHIWVPAICGARERRQLQAQPQPPAREWRQDRPQSMKRWLMAWGRQSIRFHTKAPGE